MSLLSYSGVGGILQVLEAHPDSSASSPFCKHLSFSLLVKSVAWPLSPTRLEMRPCPSLRTERRVLGGRAGFPLLINFSGLDKSVPEPRVEWYLLWLLSDSFFREEVNTNPFWYQISLDGTTLLTPGRTSWSKVGGYFSSSSSPLDIPDLYPYVAVLAWLRLPSWLWTQLSLLRAICCAHQLRNVGSGVP